MKEKSKNKSKKNKSKKKDFFHFLKNEKMKNLENNNLEIK